MTSPAPSRYVLVPLVEPAEAFTSVSGHEMTRWAPEGFPEVLAYVYDGKPTITGPGLSGVHVEPADAIARASVYVSAALKACEMAGQREPADVLALPAPDNSDKTGALWFDADVEIGRNGLRWISDGERLDSVIEVRARALALLAQWAENHHNQEAP